MSEEGDKQPLNNNNFLLTPREPCALRDGGFLTSAAGHGGVQARALGDVELGQLLGAGGVDPYRLHQVRDGGPAPGHKTHWGHSFCCFPHTGSR